MAMRFDRSFELHQRRAEASVSSGVKSVIGVPIVALYSAS
jgi:hypothetical protein